MTTATNQPLMKTLKLVRQVSIHSQDFQKHPKSLKARIPSSQEKNSMGKFQQPAKELLQNPSPTRPPKTQNPEPFPLNPRTAGKPKPGGRRRKFNRSPQKDAIENINIVPLNENCSLAPTNSSHSQNDRSCSTQHQSSRSLKPEWEV